MHLKFIELENTGPIDHLRYDLPFTDNQNPKPIVFVGKNGSGKSIVLSHIVNAMILAHGTVFDDTDVAEGKVYKLRSGNYIRYEQNYSKADLQFTDGFQLKEIQLNRTRKMYENDFDVLPLYSDWGGIAEHEHSHLHTNFHQNKAKLEVDILKSALLYFPPNRFEEPAWLNETNLINKAEYLSTNNIKEISNRPVINYAPMKVNQNWLLDIIYDGFAVERTFNRFPNQNIELSIDLQVGVQSYAGPATNIRFEIERFMLTLFGGERPVQWGVGSRGRRSISLTGNGKVLTNNVFSMSTGQAVLVDIFLSIIRDADIAGAEFNSLAELKGMVVIDEIDLHLHTELQHTILPELIKLFPKVQFILTSHSPLFLMGLSNALGEDGFDIVNLPSGEKIDVERFSEFEAAYEHFTSSAKFENEMQTAIAESLQPLLFVEGQIDIDYLKKAAELHGRTELVEKFQIVDGEGCSGLNKIWKNYHSKHWSNVSQKVILLYDCDVNMQDNQIGNAYKRTIAQQEHKIEKGVENLFSDDTICCAKEYKPAFLDIIDSHQAINRGEVIQVPEKWCINKDEKRNLCDWLIENGTAEDFESFSEVLDMLEALLGQN